MIVLRLFIIFGVAIIFFALLMSVVEYVISVLSGEGSDENEEDEEDDESNKNESGNIKSN